MEHSINEISAVKRNIVITLSGDEFKPFYSSKFKEVSSTVEIKGFRKGKVPPNIVKKFFNDKIIADAQLEAVNDAFQKLMKQLDIKMVDGPHLVDIKDNDGGVEFILEYETIPVLPLADYKSLTILEPVYKVKEEDIDKAVEDVKMKYGIREGKDEITSDNFFVKIHFLGDDNRETPEYDDDEDNPAIQEVFLKAQELPKTFAPAFLNKKIGDIVEYKEAENLPELKYEIKGIEELVPAELNEEMIKKITSDKHDNIEDFREEISFQIQENYDEKSRELMEEQIIEEIVDQNADYPYPQSIYPKHLFEYVKAFYRNNQKMEITEEIFNKNYEFFDKTFRKQVDFAIRWNILSDRIIEIEKLEAEDEDIDNFINEAIRVSPNLNNPQIIEIIKKDEKIKTQILSKKLMELLLDFTSTESIEFSEYLENRRAKLIAKNDEHFYSSITRDEETNEELFDDIFEEIDEAEEAEQTEETKEELLEKKDEEAEQTQDTKEVKE